MKRTPVRPTQEEINLIMHRLDEKDAIVESIGDDRGYQDEWDEWQALSDEVDEKSREIISALDNGEYPKPSDVLLNCLSCSTYIATCWDGMDKERRLARRAANRLQKRYNVSIQGL